MRFENEKGSIAIAMMLEANKLESPAMTGYRFGMKSACVIGRKLGIIYDVPCEVPREVAVLLQALEKKLPRQS